MSPDVAPPADLRALVERAVTVLLAVPDAEAVRRPAPDKSSPKEVLSHLIDSAVGHHQRIVQALERGDSGPDGYGQDAWVEAQRYEDADWSSLVTLWWMYNVHIARAVTAVPADARLRPALDALVRDYVAHVRLHLARILPGPAEDVPSSYKDR